MVLHLVAALAVAHNCPLLAPTPFKVRAIKAKDDEWTADIFFEKWPAHYAITLHWPEPTALIIANHVRHLLVRWTSR